MIAEGDFVRPSATIIVVGIISVVARNWNSNYSRTRSRVGDQDVCSDQGHKSQGK